MFEWIVMGFFIGVPVLLMVGALVAWIMQRRQDFSVEELDSTTTQDISGGSPA